MSDHVDIGWDELSKLHHGEVIGYHLYRKLPVLVGGIVNEQRHPYMLIYTTGVCYVIQLQDVTPTHFGYLIRLDESMFTYLTDPDNPFVTDHLRCTGSELHKILWEV